MMGPKVVVIALLTVPGLVACGGANSSVAPSASTSPMSSPSSHITGVIVVSGGVMSTSRSPRPIAGVGTVRWTDVASHKTIDVRTGTGGAYTVALPAGTYRVQAGIDGGWPMGWCNRVLVTLPGGGQRFTADPVVVQASGSSTVDVVCDAS